MTPAPTPAPISEEAIAAHCKTALQALAYLVSYAQVMKAPSAFDAEREAALVFFRDHAPQLLSRRSQVQPVSGYDPVHLGMLYTARDAASPIHAASIDRAISWLERYFPTAPAPQGSPVAAETECAYCASLNGGHTAACTAIHDGEPPAQVPRGSRNAPAPVAAERREATKGIVYAMEVLSHACERVIDESPCKRMIYLADAKWLREFVNELWQKAECHSPAPQGEKCEALHLPLTVERRHDTTIIRDRYENLVAACSDAGEADAIARLCNGTGQQPAAECLAEAVGEAGGRAEWHCYSRRELYTMWRQAADKCENQREELALLQRQPIKPSEVTK